MKIQLKELKEAYNNAREKKLKVFMLYDFELLTDYAKYLIQFLETQSVENGDYIELYKKEKEFADKSFKYK